MCSICNKRFAQKITLQRHQTTHSDERKFKCSICPDERYFKTQNDLSNHLVYHYEPKHSCLHCSKKCYTSTDLKKHMSYHFKPTFLCAKCGRKFYTSGDLKKHEKRKTGC